MGSVSIRGGLLYFDFRFDGQRCREYTKLDDTASNRRKMEAVLKKIEGEIALNTFDYARYFPGSTMIARFAELSQQAGVGMAAQAQAFPETPPRSNTPLFRDFVATWKVEKEVEWRHSYKAAVESMLQTHLLPAFGDKPIGDIDRAALLALLLLPAAALVYVVRTLGAEAKVQWVSSGADLVSRVKKAR